MVRHDFAERFHIVPDAHFGEYTKPLEFIELGITTLPRWRWLMRVIVSGFRMGLR